MKKEQYVISFDVDRKNTEILTKKDIERLLVEYLKENNIDAKILTHLQIRCVTEC